eukprot:41637-Prorocentrum_minimum.AAC.3
MHVITPLASPVVKRGLEGGIFTGRSNLIGRFDTGLRAGDSDAGAPADRGGAPPPRPCGAGGRRVGGAGGRDGRYRGPPRGAAAHPQRALQGLRADGVGHTTRTGVVSRLELLRLHQEKENELPASKCASDESQFAVVERRVSKLTLVWHRHCSNSGQPIKTHTAAGPMLKHRPRLEPSALERKRTNLVQVGGGATLPAHICATYSPRPILFR